MKHRIEMVDALRGFAVLAILLVHNIEHFIFPPFSFLLSLSSLLYSCQIVVVLSVYDFFATKAILLGIHGEGVEVDV